MLHTQRPSVIIASISSHTPSPDERAAIPRLSPPVVILADGEFPAHPLPLQTLHAAATVVCCDGAAKALFEHGRTPDYIVGDLDSLPDEWKERFADRLYPDASQDSNDLTKAVDFCRRRGVTQLKITGAGGRREDHTIANIALLADYAKNIEVEMLTNYGILVALHRTTTLHSRPGQQISLFSLQPDVAITSDGLKYPLFEQRLDSWWKGSLNEATGESFTLIFENGAIVVFLQYEEVKS